MWEKVELRLSYVNLIIAIIILLINRSLEGDSIGYYDIGLSLIILSSLFHIFRIKRKQNRSL